MKKLYYNGTIIPMNSPEQRTEALLTDGSTIAAAGSFEELRSAFPDALTVDLEGRTLMPAFVDGHSHFLLSMQTAGMADLNGCSSFEDMISVMQEYIRSNRLTGNDAAIGWGYDHNFLPGESHPDKTVLDRISPDIPVCVVHHSGHMCCMNTAALRLSGIHSKTADPSGGRIGRSAGSDEPDGYLEEAAMYMGMTVVAEKLPKRNIPSVRTAEKLYLENGITTVQDGGATRQTVETLIGLDRTGSIHVDVVIYPLMEENALQILDDYADFAEHRSGHIMLGGCKLILDGSPQGKSAWLTEPYENSGSYCGYPRCTDEQVLSFLDAALSRGRQVLAHCNGDAAGDQFLSCYEKAWKNCAAPGKHDLRPVMVHCQTARKDQIDRMSKLNMVPTVFTGHIYYWGDIHIKNLGTVRGSRISPCRWAADAGLPFSLHQDTPVTRPNMLHSIWCAVNRISRSGQKIGEQQKIPVYEAFRAASWGGAYSYHEENSKGTLEPGKTADMIILDRDPFSIDPMEIRNLKVLETIKDGETLYRNGELTY